MPAAAILSQSLQFAKAVKYPNPYRQGEVLAEIAITYAKAQQYNQAIQLIPQEPHVSPKGETTALRATPETRSGMRVKERGSMPLSLTTYELMFADNL